MMRLVSTGRSGTRLCDDEASATPLPAALPRSAAEFVGTFLRLAEIDLPLVQGTPENHALDAFVLDLAQTLDVFQAGEAARGDDRHPKPARQPQREIGRASCRERVRISEGGES